MNNEVEKLLKERPRDFNVKLARELLMGRISPDEHRQARLSFSGAPNDETSGVLAAMGAMVFISSGDLHELKDALGSAGQAAELVAESGQVQGDDLLFFNMVTRNMSKAAKTLDKYRGWDT